LRVGSHRNLEQLIHDAAADYRPRLVELLQAAIKIPSVSGSEGDCADWFSARVKDLSLETDIWEPGGQSLTGHRAFVDSWPDYHGRPNVVGVRRGLGGGRRLILNGHVDVVPVDDLTKWHRDPWGAQVEDDRLYGRGSVDMKGGCIVALACLEVLENLSIKLAGDVAAHFVVDEEATGNGTLAAVLRGHYGANSACLILEPTGPGALVAASRGAQYFRIVVPGHEVATEYQADYPNAINEAAYLIGAIDDFRAAREALAQHDLYGEEYQRVYAKTRIPLAVCRAQAGAWPSTLPADCTLEGTIECLPGEDIDEIFSAFRRFLLETFERRPWLARNRPVVEAFGLRYESAATDPRDPFVALTAAVSAEVVGATPAIVGGAGSDLRHPVLYGQTPTVAFGPSGGPYHAVDEWVSISQLVQYLEICLRLAISWCGVIDD
jgi:acetylornithine deacetylase